MPKLSNMPGTAPYNQHLTEVHVPFTAFLKADPIGGKRFETIRSLERQSARIEEQLVDLCGTAGSTFDFSRPVAFTFQFGDKTARFTVNGHACVRSEFTNRPLEEVAVDHDNKSQIGIGESNGARAVASPELNAIAKEVKDQLEIATGLQVIRLKIAGYIYGYKGVHFPQ